jgi:hypothetical protein
VEALETIELLSWASVPPAAIAPPANSPPSIYLNGVTLSAAGGASGSGINIQGEIDYYQFTATRSGTYVFAAVSPGHALNTVIAVYDSSGHRVASNDNVAPGDTNSETSVTLTAGKRYSFGVTNELSNATHGRYNWSIAGPALAGFQSAIESRAHALGLGFTGARVSGLEAVADGYRIRYANGDVFDSAATGVRSDHGAIRDEYNAIASETDVNGKVVQNVLGMPTSDEKDVPGVPGARMNTFEGGAIYWSPATGPHVVYGATAAKFNALGGAAGFGLPTSDEASLGGDPPNVRVTNFRNAAGIYASSIYLSPAAGVHAVHGAIGAEYTAGLLGQTGGNGVSVRKTLGAPTSDEMNVPGAPGARMNTFQGGAIYWSPATGAHVVYSGIGGLYNSLGGAASFLGLPTSDEQGPSSSRYTFFQHGKIVWTPQGGAKAVQAVSQMSFGTGGFNFGSGITDVPVQGSAHLDLFADGTYHFTGHLHDSGILSYRDSLAIGIKGSSGVLYVFVHQGHMAGPLEPGSSSDNWDYTGNSPQLAALWTDIEGGQFYWGAHVNSGLDQLIIELVDVALVVLPVNTIVSI